MTNSDVFDIIVFMLVQPHKENVMKTITQDQAYEMFLTGNQINVVKNKQVLVKQVQSDMQYTTVVAKEDGSLIVEIDTLTIFCYNN